MVDDVSIDSLVSDSHCFIFFFFNDTATTEIYTLSLHDALPISKDPWFASRRPESEEVVRSLSASGAPARRKSGSPATLPAFRSPPSPPAGRTRRGPPVPAVSRRRLRPGGPGYGRDRAGRSRRAAVACAPSRDR